MDSRIKLSLSTLLALFIFTACLTDSDESSSNDSTNSSSEELNFSESLSSSDFETSSIPQVSSQIEASSEALPETSVSSQQETSVDEAQTTLKTSQPFTNSGSYTLEGRVSIQESSSGTLSLQFSEDFIISAGPDLYIYLLSEAYTSPGNGQPDDVFWQSAEQIGQSGISTSGTLKYNLEGVSKDKLSSIQGIAIYCQRFGYILWGGSNF